MSKIETRSILLLVPRCIQNSECRQNIAKDIDLCRRCGRCKVKDILDLGEELKVSAFVATGGSVALSKAEEPWVAVVVAIGCEWELASGILSCTKPVLAINNLRPLGPCADTDVDMKCVRKALLSFIGSSAP